MLPYKDTTYFLLRFPQGLIHIERKEPEKGVSGGIINSIEMASLWQFSRVVG